MAANLKEEILDLMAEILEVSKDELEDDTAVGDIESWDSLHHLLIIAAIEKKYDIHFTPDILIDIEDVADLVRETGKCIGA